MILKAQPTPHVPTHLPTAAAALPGKGLPELRRHQGPQVLRQEQAALPGMQSLRVLDISRLYTVYYHIDHMASGSIVDWEGTR